MPTPFRQLEIRRGLKANLPALVDGELGFCTDTKELFVGFGGSNFLLGYLSPNPPLWAGSPPTSLASAVSRLAAAVQTLLGGPIP